MVPKRTRQPCVVTKVQSSIRHPVLQHSGEPYSVHMASSKERLESSLVIPRRFRKRQEMMEPDSIDEPSRGNNKGCFNLVCTPYIDC